MALWVCFIPMLFALISAPLSISLARPIAIGGVLLQIAVLFVAFTFGFDLAGTFFGLPFSPIRLEITHTSTLFLGSTMGASLFSMWLGWRQKLEARAFFQHVLVTNAAVCTLVVTKKLVSIPFFWELAAIPLTIGIALWGRKDAARSAFQFVGYQLFFGLVIAACLASRSSITTQLFGVPVENLSASAYPHKEWISLALTLALMGKMAVFPFHGWLFATFRSIHPSGAILLVGAFLGGTLSMALKLQPLLHGPWLTGAGLVAYVYCSLLAYRVDSFRALIATLLGAQLGLAAIALVHSPNAYLLLISQILIVFSVLGALVGIIEKRRGESTLSTSTGLARSTPRLGAFLILFLAATLPLPLLPAFPGTFLLIQSGIPSWMIPVIAIILLFQVSLIIQICENLFRHNLPKGVREIKELKIREWWALIPATLLILCMGAFSSRVLDFLNPTAL